MTPQELQGMTLRDISAYITKRHGLELRSLAPALAAMKDQDRQQRLEGVVLFLAGSIRWTGGDAVAIKGELNRRLRAMEL